MLCALGLMICVPLTSANPRPSRLGWHMYATAVDLPKVGVMFTDGTFEERTLSDIASGVRPELDYVEPVARFICAREHDVASVRFTRTQPNLEMVVECAGS